jgi:phage terminase small subunit
MARKSLTRKGRPAKTIRKASGKLRQDRPLTDAHLLFIDRYMVHRVAARAYRESHPGVTPATADSEGSRLKADPRVSQEIKRRVAALSKKYEHSADRVLRELSFMAFGTLLDLYDDEGRLLDPQNIPDEVGRGLKKLEYEAIHGKDADGERTVIGHVVKAEMHSKPEALKLLGQHYGVLKEQVEVSASGEFADLLRAARERASAPR